MANFHKRRLRLYQVISLSAVLQQKSIILIFNLQLMDNDDDGFVSARGLSVALGLSTRADAQRRLRALYCAHAPPLLSHLELRPTHFTETGEELAADAISFFDG